VYDKDFADKLLRSFYVDDLATGEVCTESAYLLYTKARERMNEGGFKLRKWRTNDSESRTQIQESANDLDKHVEEAEKQTYGKSDWGHCPGIENPADLGSRGVFITELKNSDLWWSCRAVMAEG
jgi:hypothetical protein